MSAQVQSAGRGTAPAEAPIIDQHSTQVEQNAVRAEALSNRLHRIADRLFGERPTPLKDQAGAAPNPTYSFGRLSNAHQSMEASLNQILAAIERLEVL
jgi:hypothetical protein